MIISTHGIASGTANFDVLSVNTLLLLHWDGPHGGATFTDSSQYNRTVTHPGSLSISDVQSRFGGTSMFSGGGQLEVSLPELPGDFTIEAWVYNIGIGSGNEIENPLFELAPASNGFIVGMGPNSYGNYQLSGYGTNISSRRPMNTSSNWFTTGVWQHFAMVRQLGVVKVYLDGVFVPISDDPWPGTLIEGTWSAPNAVSPAVLRIGGSSYVSGYMYGFVDEFRVCDIAVYTKSFVPQTTAFKLL